MEINRTTGEAIAQLSERIVPVTEESRIALTVFNEYKGLGFKGDRPIANNLS